MTVNEVNAVIDHLSMKLAYPADQLMALAAGIGVKTLVAVILLTAIGSAGIGFSIWLCRKGEDDACVLPFMVGLAAWIVDLFMIPSVILWLTNPKAWVLDLILKSLK